LLNHLLLCASASVWRKYGVVANAGAGTINASSRGLSSVSIHSEISSRQQASR